MRWLDNIRCFFGNHPEYNPTRILSRDCDQIVCTNCGRKFIICYQARVIAKWDDKLEETYQQSKLDKKELKNVKRFYGQSPNKFPRHKRRKRKKK